ncbi:unnamed protein product [Allacma fusca]|uniref:Uncharacterized protein n=1 Tax=Allacma fusca TaxID=39272 RepID=A0A8J2L8P6_9HEXA|nr:unnamed protein product [Allacma fusca]
MEPIPPKKRFLSKASVIHHNKGTKRPMLQREVEENERKPLDAFPVVQRDCGAKCKQPGYPVPEHGSKARMHWNYKLPILYAKADVCQTTFRKTLNVSDSQISRIQKRMVETQEIFPRNLRGRHDNRPHRLLEDTIKLIKEHLESYGAVENHYTRNKYDETVTFLPPHHTIKQLHLNYMDVHGNDYPVSECTFRAQFHCFHFKIGNPYDDTCDTCDYLQLKLQSAETEEEKIHLQHQKQGHLAMADLTLNRRKQDIERARTDRNFIVLSVDMQQTFFTPKLTNASAFYLHGYFSNVYPKFAISGHSYLSCDMDFSFIERQLKKRPPITPNDLITPILEANSVTPFEIHKMTQDHFYDLKLLVNYWKRPAELKISQLLVFHQHRTLPTRILAKHSHSDAEVWVTFENKFRNRHIDPGHIPGISRSLKYNGLLPLKSSKQNDLVKMMKFLTAADQEFFTPFLDVSANHETRSNETEN